MDLLKRLFVIVICCCFISALYLSANEEADGIQTTERVVNQADSTLKDGPATTDVEANAEQPKVHSLKPQQPPAQPLKALELKEEIQANANIHFPQDI